MKVNDEYTHVGITFKAKERAIQYLDSLPPRDKYRPTIRDFVTDAVEEILSKLPLLTTEK